MNKKELKMALINRRIEAKSELEILRVDPEMNENRINEMLDRLNYIDRLLEEIDNEN